MNTILRCFMASLLVLACSDASAQNTAVRWWAIGGGVALSARSNTAVLGLSGQTLGRQSSGSGILVSSGFLGNAKLVGPAVSVRDPGEMRPAVTSLSQNFPNPFNPTTKIQFTIANRQLTIVKVFDVLGRDVATLANEVKQPGTYAVEFDGSNLASGVYFYRLQAGDFTQTRRLVLTR